jgi:HD-GYP domain-containing protein (c-di-GMP phosphodiesterase class II)
MTGVRPYAVRRSVEAALAELQACAGTQFDPAVVAAFAVAYRDQRLAAAA